MAFGSVKLRDVRSDFAKLLAAPLPPCQPASDQWWQVRDLCHVIAQRRRLSGVGTRSGRSETSVTSSRNIAVYAGFSRYFGEVAQLRVYCPHEHPCLFFFFLVCAISRESLVH